MHFAELEPLRQGSEGYGASLEGYGMREIVVCDLEEASLQLMHFHDGLLPGGDYQSQRECHEPGYIA